MNIMKQLSSRYLSLSLLFVLALAPRYLARACGPEIFTDDTRFALFNPDIAGMPGLEPFYFSERFLNADIPDPQGVDYKRNCREWSDYCGRNVEVRDVYAIQYRTKPDDFLYASSTGDWKGYDGNTFVAWLVEKDHRKVLQYMAFAKKAEALLDMGYDDPWHAESRPRDNGISIARMADSASMLCNRTPESFLRQRYAFQAVRLWYYMNSLIDSSGKGSMEARRDSINLYAEKYLTGKSVVCGWTYVYRALVQPDDVLRNYYMVRAFDESEEKKICAFRWLSLADLDALSHSSYGAEIAEPIMAIKGLKNPGRALGQIVQLHNVCPNSNYLPMLVGREINKLEEWLWTPELLHFFPNIHDNEWGGHYHRNGNGEFTDTTYGYIASKNYRKDLLYLGEVQRVVSKLAQNTKKGSPFLPLPLPIYVILRKTMHEQNNTPVRQLVRYLLVILHYRYRP